MGRFFKLKLLKMACKAKQWGLVTRLLHNFTQRDVINIYRDALFAGNGDLVNVFNDMYGKPMLMQFLDPDVVLQCFPQNDIVTYFEDTSSLAISGSADAICNLATAYNLIAQGHVLNHDFLEGLLASNFDYFNIPVLRPMLQPIMDKVNNVDMTSLYDGDMDTTSLIGGAYKVTNTGAKFKIYTSEEKNKSVLTLPSTSMKTTKELLDTLSVSQKFALRRYLCEKNECDHSIVIIYVDDGVTLFTILEYFDFDKSMLTSFQKTRDYINTQLRSLNSTYKLNKIGYVDMTSGAIKTIFNAYFE